jgi:AcrR family transcriptional regulator
MSSVRPRLTADARREQIVAAARSEFAAHGYQATTTDAIARRAGVSQPYVVRLFGTKQALFLAAADSCFTQLHEVFTTAAAAAPPGQKLDAMGAAYRDLVADRELLALQLHFFAACAADPSLREIGNQRFAALIEHERALSGASEGELIRFNALGMLINVATALGLELDYSSALT